MNRKKDKSLRLSVKTREKDSVIKNIPQSSSSPKIIKKKLYHNMLKYLAMLSQTAFVLRNLAFYLIVPLYWNSSEQL